MMQVSSQPVFRAVGSGRQGRRRRLGAAPLVLRPTPYMRMSRQMNRLLKREKLREVKVLSFADSDAIGYGGAFVHITDIDQGDQISQRTGDQIEVKSFQLRVVWGQNSAATVGSQMGRVILFRDMNANSGTFPTQAELLASPGAADSIISGINEFYRFRFQILLDRVVIVDQQVDNFSFSRTFKTFLVPRRKRVRYDGTAGTDFNGGQYFIHYFCNDATNNMSITYNITTKFYDSG